MSLLAMEVDVEKGDIEIFARRLLQRLLHIARGGATRASSKTFRAP
jgi:hypothetical protein